MTHLIVNERTAKGKQLMEHIRSNSYKPNELKLIDEETGEELIPLEVVKADFMKELKAAYAKKKQTSK